MWNKLIVKQESLLILGETILFSMILPALEECEYYQREKGLLIKASSNIEYFVIHKKS